MQQETHGPRHTHSQVSSAELPAARPSCSGALSSSPAMLRELEALLQHDTTGHDNGYSRWELITTRFLIENMC